jgi:hypothetical protein
MSEAHDTMPPDFSQMNEKQLLVHVANELVAVHQRLNRIEQQFEAGDGLQDKLTVAQRLQSVAAKVEHIDEKLDHQGGQLHGRIENLEEWRKREESARVPKAKGWGE